MLINEDTLNLTEVKSKGLLSSQVACPTRAYPGLCGSRWLGVCSSTWIEWETFGNSPVKEISKTENIYHSLFCYLRITIYIKPKCLKKTIVTLSTCTLSARITCRSRSVPVSVKVSPCLWPVCQFLAGAVVTVALGVLLWTKMLCILKVSDVDQIMGLVQAENIQVHAESYDVALDMSFPKGT